MSDGACAIHSSATPTTADQHSGGPAVARSLSVRVVTLALPLSLLSPNAQPAFAVGACASSPTHSACEIAKPSSYQVVVNKVRPLTSPTYQPSDLQKVPRYNPYGRILRKSVSSAVVHLGDAMKAAGKGTLVLQSGYRSYYSQKSILAAKIKAIGKTKALKV